jgi:hypothetical protein
VRSRSSNQEQRVRIAKQKAQIRYQNAIGVQAARRTRSQKTLTPLYVQFEMVDALKTIAQSGSEQQRRLHPRRGERHPADLWRRPAGEAAGRVEVTLAA